ncbi:MAG: hypothetical protein K9J16_02975 [Melioribacteraceae bacterium]|nr:hypothetical protein [Melioribacteraceae bacterium]MCF8355462.1 hypothetical protein [Melioribacteraceae bacterium]MCF8392561.1 hypothetical protein [Melioribacteraceae bacterium]MCF8418424.1 hypothetical protein [Melioribacteraceae bacterium]
MKKKSIIKNIYKLILIAILFACSESDDALAPYEGSPSMSNINIEENSYNPKITWLGGYVSVVGVNQGDKAALDSSLIWLIHSSGDNIQYPVTYGSLPSNAESLQSEYGGKFIESLVEDNGYNFWVLKENAWKEISGTKNKYLAFDSSIVNGEVIQVEDTLLLSDYEFTSLNYFIDAYVNIDTSNVLSAGRLAQITLQETDTSNSLIVDWEIAQTGITDSLLSAAGICIGEQYDINKALWEVWSVHEENGEAVYGKRNVLSKPFIVGQSFDSTHVFVEFPETGLERNQNYYIWIASKEWDGERRGRTVNGYAYIKLSTW